jgi:hypothetical protein
MPLLYKYLAPGTGPKGEPLLPAPLRTMTLLASNPCSFNDPFEVRPCFDQERHDHFAQSHETFYSKLGIKHSLMGNRSMVGIPTENVVGFGERLNKRFRDELGKRFRVLCLSRTSSSVLMWGHYTSSHSGVVLGVDTDHPAFPKGLKPEGFDIQYCPERTRTKLPLAFYQGPSVEMYDPSGNIVNSPHQLVENDGGLLIPFREYRRRVEEATVTALTTKAEDWHYEREVRFIFELPRHHGQLVVKDGLSLVPIPPDALREIIVGFRAGARMVGELVRLFRNGKIGKPKLLYSTCHPNRYEVQAHEADDQYLLDYFESVLPNQ